jgi:hypothetical protein
MRKVGLGLLSAVIGCLVAAYPMVWDTRFDDLCGAGGSALVLIGIAACVAQRRGFARVTLKLDWFLPFRHQRASGSQLTRWSGRVRRAANGLGPTVVASPLRRTVQAAFFLVFLLLFYWVCWPYAAEPADPGADSTGWDLIAVDQAASVFRFSHPSVPAWIAMTPDNLHLADESAADARWGYVGAFERQSCDGREIALRPVTDLTVEQLDKLLTSMGPWSIHEKSPMAWPSHYFWTIPPSLLWPALVEKIDFLVGLTSSGELRNRRCSCAKKQRGPKAMSSSFPNQLNRMTRRPVPKIRILLSANNASTTSIELPGSPAMLPDVVSAFWKTREQGEEVRPWRFDPISPQRLF